jgi:hypothetical protein
VVRGISRSPQHSPKAARIPKTENHAVIQEQIDMVVLLWGDISCKGKQSQAARHAEMQDQRARAAVEQKVFSTTRYRSDFQAAKRSLKVWHRPAQIRISYRQAGDLAPLEFRGDAATDNFDFRQFRQFECRDGMLG